MFIEKIALNEIIYKLIKKSITKFAIVTLPFRLNQSLLIPEWHLVFIHTIQFTLIPNINKHIYYTTTPTHNIRSILVHFLIYLTKYSLQPFINVPTFPLKLF